MNSSVYLRIPLDEPVRRTVQKYLRALAVAGGLLFFALAIVTVATLDDSDAVASALPLPNVVAYKFHAAVGTALNGIGAPPVDAGIQWVKAASHARSPARVAHAARGIAVARARANGTSDAYFDATLCAMILHGSPASIGAVQQSGIHC